jgi:aminoglycoside phosphotransferase (APT) family kinase protein
VDIDETLVRSLLAEQHPQWAQFPLKLLDAGMDNVIYRLGADRLVRLPRREKSAPLMEKELIWLPQLASRLPLPVPTPVAGSPARGFPWRWSVVPWFDGVSADQESLADDQVLVLAEFLRALHQTAPSDAPVNPYRGVPLAMRSDIPAKLDRVLNEVNTESDTVRRLWERAVAAPPASAVWIHGDLHPRNVIVRDGVLAAVIDWGDMAAGDPATDLACAWMLFDHWSGTDALFDAYGAGPDLVRRALGWAIVFATVLLGSGLPEPHPRLGKSLFAALVRYGGGA